MTGTREIAHILKSKPTIEGAGVRLKRTFGHAEAPLLDPFLLLDDFHSDNPEAYLAGFPWHPTGGIETVTYVLKGLIEHGDSTGNKLIAQRRDKRMAKIDVLFDTFPLSSEDSGIDVKTPSGRFKWFVAAILFGARISEKIAANTYLCFERYGIDSPEKITAAGWDELVRILDEGGYVRYDFSTATKLLAIMKTLQAQYGTLEALYEHSLDTKDLERRLQEFKGVGAVTTQIFLRELRGVWVITQRSRTERSAPQRIWT